MTRIARKSDGRRIFTDEFKRQQLGHVWRGEMTLAELSRKLGIARSLLQRWKRNMPQETGSNGATRVRAPSSGTLGGDQYIRELQRLVGRQAVELELLHAELERLKRGRRSVAAPPR